jgi:hypothetical protein
MGRGDNHSNTCIHGTIEQLTPDWLKMHSLRADGNRNIEYLRLDTIVRFSPDAPELHLSQVEAAYYTDDDDGKEMAGVQ